jgi:hypothetical protein
MNTYMDPFFGRHHGEGLTSRSFVGHNERLKARGGHMRFWHCAASALVLAASLAACDETNVKDSEFPANWLDAGHDAGVPSDAGAPLDAGSLPSWQPVTPEGVTTYPLRAVTGSRAGTNDTGFAVGANKTILTWRRPTSTNPPWQPTNLTLPFATTVEWRAASFDTSSSKTWIAGTGGAVLSWDGMSSAFVDMSLPAPNTPDLNALSAQGGAIWVAGAGGARWYWDGTWHDKSGTGGTGDVNGLWSNGTVLLSAGADGLLRSNGAAWPSLYSGKFAAIHGAGNFAWAVGDNLVVRYDLGGNSGAPRTPPGAAVNWRAVVAIADNDVWIASAQNVLQHWNGTGWTSIQGYDTATPGATLYGLTSAASGTWAVGDSIILKLLP